jgi:hypothetical protein
MAIRDNQLYSATVDTETAKQGHEVTALEEIRETERRHVTMANNALQELDVLLNRLFGTSGEAGAMGGPAEVPSGLVAEISDAQTDLGSALESIVRRVARLNSKL